MDWDPLQRDVLAAMGHDVYRVAGAEPVPLPDDALLRALLRACGRDASAADALALSREWMPTARYTDPSAKRALWPRLRNLRKGLSSMPGSKAG